MLELWLLHIMNDFAAIKNELALHPGLQNFHKVLLGENKKKQKIIYNKILVFCSKYLKNSCLCTYAYTEKYGRITTTF